MKVVNNQATWHNASEYNVVKAHLKPADPGTKTAPKGESLMKTIRPWIMVAIGLGRCNRPNDTTCLIQSEPPTVAGLDAGHSLWSSPY